MQSEKIKVKFDLRHPRRFLQLADCLKRENVHEKINITFIPKKEDELAFIQFMKKRIQANKLSNDKKFGKFGDIIKVQEKVQNQSESVSSLSSEEESEDLILQSDSDEDLEKALGNTKKDNKFKKQLSQQEQVYIFYPRNREIFFKVYEHDIKSLEQRYDCQILETKDKNVQIRRISQNVLKQLKDDLFSKSNNINTFLLDIKHKIVLHSKVVEEKLRQKKMYLIRGKNVFIWSLKKDMNQEIFKKHIDQMILAKCRRRAIVFTREPLKQKPSFNHYLQDFFTLFEKYSKKKYAKMQSIFNIRIEVIHRYFEIITHLDAVQFAEQVVPFIRRQFEQILMFSFTVELSDLKKMEVLNFCRRNHPKILVDIFQQKFTVLIPFSKIQSSLCNFLTDIFNMNILGAKSKLIIPFSHIKNHKQFVNLLNNNLPEGAICKNRTTLSIYNSNMVGNEVQIFEKILLMIGNVLIGKSLNDTSMSQTQNGISIGNLLINNTSMDIGSEVNETYDNNQSNYLEEEKQPNQKQQSQFEESQLQPQLEQEQYQEQEQPFPFELTPKFTDAKTFYLIDQFPNKKKLQDYFTSKFDEQQFTIKAINLSQNLFSSTSLKNPILYLLNEQFIENDKPKGVINLLKFDSKNKQFKYLVQAEGDNKLSAKYGSYLPLYEVKKIIENEAEISYWIDK